MGPWGWFVACFARWLPHATPAGLQRVGSPGRDSPVIVTANFSLSVRRVRRALAGRDAWLIVVPTDGINVWCAASGGIFTHQRVIDAVKVSRVAQEVDHRRLTMPALAAPGVDRKKVREATGFKVRFGPVYARDLPAYLDAGCHKTDSMRRFRFDLPHRLEMLVPMNFPAWLILAGVLAVVRPDLILGTSLLFWGAIAWLYLLAPWIPGRTGWAQAFLSATALIAAWAAFDWVRFDDPLRHWGWLTGTFGIFFLAGFDLAGIALPRKSDPERMLHRLGVTRLGTLFSQKDLGEVTLDRTLCTGCSTCHGICPVGVFGPLDRDKKTTFERRDTCFNCGACVTQCPEKALTIR